MYLLVSRLSVLLASYGETIVLYVLLWAALLTGNVGFAISQIQDVYADLELNDSSNRHMKKIIYFKQRWWQNLLVGFAAVWLGFVYVILHFLVVYSSDFQFMKDNSCYALTQNTGFL